MAIMRANDSAGIVRARLRPMEIILLTFILNLADFFIYNFTDFVTENIRIA